MLTDTTPVRNRLIRNVLLSFPGAPLRELPEQMKSETMEMIFDAISDRTWLETPLAQRDKLSPVMSLLGQSREGDAEARVLEAFDKASADYDIDMMEALLAFDMRAVNHASARDRVAACGPWVRPMLRCYHDGDPEPRVYLVMLFRATPNKLRDALVAKILRFCDELGFPYSMVREIAKGDADFAEIVNTLAPADAPALTEH
jgi:hypothetical protein